MMPDARGSVRSALPTDDLLYAALHALEGSARLRVRLGGISMTPFIRPGTPADVGPAPARPRRGMVLVCRRQGGVLTIHRVIGVRRIGATVWVRTKGDALSRDDGWWAPDEVLGQIVALYQDEHPVPLDRGWRAWIGWGVGMISPASSGLHPAWHWARRQGSAWKRRARV